MEFTNIFFSRLLLSSFLYSIAFLNLTSLIFWSVPFNLYMP